MIRRTLLVSLLLVCGLVLRAPAQSFTCGAVVAGHVTCTFGGGVTFNVPHDTVPKFIHDTVPLPAPPPIHDTLPPKIVNHYCTLTGSVWDCSALTPPVVIVPPPPPVAGGYVFAKASVSRTTSGVAVFADSMAVSWTDGAGAPGWGLSSRAGWNSGVDHPGYPKGVVGYGSGMAHWLTNLVGRPAGLYVDTIAISVNGVATAATFIDSVRVAGTVVPPPPPPPPPPVTPPPPPPPVTPPPTTLGPHPRVWMNPSRVTFLKAQAAANTVRWQNVKIAADDQLKVGAPNSILTLPALCLAYLGTGNAAYAARAGALLTANTDSVAIVALQSDDGYDYRVTLPYITNGLDWCYAGLTVAQRQRTATWLMDQADWLWPETNSAPHNTYGLTDPTDNYYWGYMMTGPAALAAAGDDTGVGAVSGKDRATYHQNLALGRWQAAATNVLGKTLVGGAHVEGTGYDISGNVAKFVDGFQTAGIPLTSPWLAQSIVWHLQYTMPGGQFFIPFGDQARVSNAPMYIYNREAMLGTLAVANAGPALNAEVQHWLGVIGQVPTRFDDGNIGNELIYYDPLAPTVADFSALPTGYLAAGAGDFVYRQSWTNPAATVFAFQSGPLSESHSSLDANALMIWKGSFWISASANIYSHSGIVQPSQYFNTLTVGGIGQENHNGARIVQNSISDSLVVVSAQADSTYFWPPGYRATYSVAPYDLRTVAYLPVQDAFVIVDRVTARDSSQAKVWRWHSLNAAVISGNTFTLATPNKDQRCVGTVLLPTTAVLADQPFTLGAAGDTTTVTSHAVTVTLPTGRPTDVVVTVFQCSAQAAASVTVTASGVSVLVGAKRVAVPTDPTQPVTVGP